MTVVLAIDTALNACSAAVVVDGAVLAARSEAMARGQAERLAPLVQEAMAEAGVGFSALDRVAVTTGPGSFTGVRIGLAFARSLGVALGRPVLGLDTLRALALNAPPEAGVQAACIVTPGAMYLGAWDAGLTRIAPQAVERSEASAMLAALNEGVLIGPGAAGLSPVGFSAQELAFPTIELIALWAAQASPELNPPDPTYLRPPGATPPA